MSYTDSHSLSLLGALPFSLSSMDRFLPCLARRLPPFALLVLAAMLAAPAQADEGALAYDGNMLAGADLAPGAALRTPPASTGFLQDSEVNEDILLPAAGPQDDDPGPRWPRDYFGVAVGANSVPRDSGGAEKRVLPGFSFPGRVHGHYFPTPCHTLHVTLTRTYRTVGA